MAPLPLQLLVVVPLVAAFIPDANYTFEQFTADYSRSYRVGSSEYVKRKQIFELGLKRILVHNSNPDMTWRRGINNFADLTEAEFAMSGRLGYNKLLAREHTSISAGEVSTPTPPLANMPLPKSIDWREKGVVSNVKDQGQCGSCWAFATTETVESHVALATGMLPVLSPQQLVSCAPNPLSCGGVGGCQGSIPEVAFTYIQLFGMASEWVYPYTSYHGSKPGMKCDWNSSMHQTKFTIAGYKKLPPNDYKAMMTALATVGPLAVNVATDSWHDYEGGVFDGCSNHSNIDIDHVVQLVGYGTDPKGGDYWLVRNSWDVTWGEKGYIRLKRSSSPSCGVDATPLDGTGCKGGSSQQKVCGTCGVLFDASYPIGAGVAKRSNQRIVI